MGKRVRRLALLLSVASASLAGPFAIGAQATTFEFPSSSSAVVSGGGAPAGQVGYFWSTARGDKVSQTFAGPLSIDHAVLAIQPPTNSLSAGNEVDWTLSINGVDVGSFVVPSGSTTPIVLDRSFAPIAGPSYAVVLRVTNEVPSGGGSNTFASTGNAGPHSLDLENTVAPDTRLTSGPEATTTATSAAFTFDSFQIDLAGFQCSLDHASFAPCVSPKVYSALSQGPHSFEVSAVDAFGNVDSTPATAQWTVVAPQSPKAKAVKCKKGFKKVKRHGKVVCKKKKKKHHKAKHPQR